MKTLKLTTDEYLILTSSLMEAIHYYNERINACVKCGSDADYWRERKYENESLIKKLQK